MDNFPTTVGLIPDGNRRWARANSLLYEHAYGIAMDKIGLFIECMFLRGVSNLCIYFLSKENLNRPPEELTAVLAAEEQFLLCEMPCLLEKYQASLSFVGNLELLPAGIRAALERSCWTRGEERKIYILMAYSAFDEVKKVRGAREKISYDSFSVPVMLDLVIRTSGEQRLSGFLPLQSSYAEFIFEEKHINELEREDYYRFLRIFSERKRRFGG